MTPKSPPRPAGFTLIELLVVIGILVLLIAIALPALSRVRGNAKRAKTHADMGVIQMGLEEYKKDHGGQYPQADGINTGFAVLGRELVGVYGNGFLPNSTSNTPDDTSDPPAWLGTTTYKPGDCVGPVTGPFYVAMVESIGQSVTDKQYWAQFASARGPRDQADGPGTRLGNGGKKVSYIPPDRLKVRGCALVDAEENPILYFPARGNPNVNRPHFFIDSTAYVTPSHPEAKFNADDNVGFFIRRGPTPQGDGPSPGAETRAVQRIQAMLGDYDAAQPPPATNFDGGITGSETAVVNGSYLLWAAGPDGFYGVKTNAPPDNPTAVQISKCDDIILTSQ